MQQRMKATSLTFQNFNKAIFTLVSIRRDLLNFEPKKIHEILLLPYNQKRENAQITPK